MEKDELIKWRQKLGFSQKRIADLLDVHVITISRWERGVAKPSGINLQGLKDLQEKYSAKYR